MAKTISNLNVVLGGSIGPFASAFKGASSIVSDFTAKAGEAGESILKLTGIGAGLELGMKALHGIVEAPGELLAAAQKQIDAETKLGAVLKATGGAAGFSAEALKAHASALQKSTTFADEDIIGMQAVLATFRNVSGNAFTQATDLALDMATVLGVDLKSAGLQLGKALNDPILGIQSLHRVGIAFTEQQKAQIKAMTAAGNIAGAQAIILNQLQQSFGGASAAIANTPFGKLKQFGNLIEDLKEQIGTGLGEALAAIVKGFHLDELVEKASVAAAQLVDRFAPVGAAIMEAIEPWIDKTAVFIESTVSTIAGFISDHASIVISAIEGIGIALAAIAVPAALVSLGSLLAFIGVSLPIAAIGALVGAIATLIDQTIGWSAAWGYVEDAAIAVYGVITQVWSAIYGFVAPIVQAIWEVIVNNWVSIVDTTVSTFEAVWNVVSAIGGAIWSVLTSIWGGITAAWDAAMNFIGVSTTNTATTVGSVFQTIVDWVKWLAEGVTLGMNIAAYAIEHWRDTALLVGTTVIYEIVKMGNEIQYFFVDVIPAVLNWFSKNWVDVFTTMWDFTNTIMSNLASNVVNISKNIPGLIKGTVKFDDIWTPLTTGFVSTIKELPKIPDRVVGPLEAALGKDAKNLSDSYSEGLGEYLAKQGSHAGEGLKKALEGSAQPKLNLPEVKTPKLDTKAITAPANAATGAINGMANAVSGVKEEIKLLTTGSAEAQLAKYMAMWDGLSGAIDGAAQAQQNQASTPDIFAGDYSDADSQDATTATATAAPAPAPLPSQTVSDMRDASGGSLADLLKQLLAVETQSKTYLSDIADEPSDQIFDGG